MTLDHVGPIARNVEDCARLLQVIAGKDGIDHRFYTYFERKKQEISYDYINKVQGWKGDVTKLRIGVLKEGFIGVEEDVTLAVNSAIEKLCSTYNLTKKEVSFQGHQDAFSVFGVILMEGTYDCLYAGNMSTTNHITWANAQLNNHARLGFQSNAKDLSHTNKIYMMLGKYIKENYGSKYYAKASTLRNFFLEGYCKLFKEEVDLLVMPTLPKTAKPLPNIQEKIDIEGYVKQAFGDIGNTAPFDLTGLPALTINVAGKGALPIGLMIVGDYFQEGMILQLAKAIEELKLN
jgi:amidase